jgi:hypothetical protein
MAHAVIMGRRIHDVKEVKQTNKMVSEINGGKKKRQKFMIVS